MINLTKKNKKMEEICSVPIDLFYPPVCGICGKLNIEFLCKKCEKMLEEQSEFKVIDNNSAFDKHLYIFKYKGIIRKLIIDYKFNEKSYLYKTFVNFLLKNENFFEILQSYDRIIPVPISKKRQKERGYNQSYLIAKEIAKIINKRITKGMYDSNKVKIHCENKCLYKVKNIVAQSSLNKEERQKNIQGAYAVRNGDRIKNKKIILIDDIYTTGSTVNECCKVLKNAEVDKISVLTLAKD